MIRKQTKYWTTSDGRKLRICDMDDGHLANTITMLDRAAEIKSLQIHEELLTGAEFMRGDMAKESLENEAASVAMFGVYPGNLFPLYDNLILEKERRRSMAVREFFVAGVKFHDLKKVIGELEEGTEFKLDPEPDNKFDSNAVRLIFNGTMCGYVPKTLSAEVAALIDLRGDEVHCTITKLDPNAQPWNQCMVRVWVEGEETGTADQTEF